MDIYVDGDMTTSWTSSGTTSGFETVDLGFAGKTIDLIGVLTDSEWLSIMEVRTAVRYIEWRSIHFTCKVSPRCPNVDPILTPGLTRWRVGICAVALWLNLSSSN